MAHEIDSVSKPSAGKVFLVGAGPGDPRLLTLRGLQCLQLADCVLYDGLVNPELLDFAPQATPVCVGKHGKSTIWQQSEVNRELVRLALLGKTVVRLKGGDPAVFGRTAEELEVLTDHEIPFEVIPGITAVLAVASYTGIPLTHRDHASAVALVTGQQQADSPLEMDWRSLAKFPGTLSIYMGVTTSQFWTAELIAAGKPPETPAAIVRHCSRNDQQVVYCRLDEVAELLTPSSRMRPPVLVVVGPVAHLGKQWNWFERKALLGSGIWLPRAAHQSEELRRLLCEEGASVISHPVFRIEPPGDPADLFRAMSLLDSHSLQGITFSSTNGVDGLIRFLFDQGRDVRMLADVRLAAVGPTTALHLNRYGLRADVVPEIEFSAEGLLACLRGSVQGEHWLVTTTNRSGAKLTSGLESLAARVTECLSYLTVPCTETAVQLESALESRKVQWAVITSNSIAELAYDLLGPRASQIQPIAISAQVADTLHHLGWPPAAIALQNTASSLVEAVKSAVKTASDHKSQN